MTSQEAERTVSTSALVVGLVYAYRRLTEGQSGKEAQHLAQPGAAKQLAGAAGVPPLSHFIVGYGAAFLGISVLAELDPPLGSGLAILVATSTLLANGAQIFGLLTKQTGGTTDSGTSVIQGASRVQAHAPAGIRVPQTTQQLAQIPPLIPGTIPAP